MMKVRMNTNGSADIISDGGVSVQKNVVVDGFDVPGAVKACVLARRALDGDLDPGVAYDALIEVPGVES